MDLLLEEEDIEIGILMHKTVVPEDVGIKTVGVVLYME